MAVRSSTQGDRVKDADGSQLQLFHYEYPAEGGRGVEREAKVKPTRPQRLLARAGELEEVVPQYTDHAENTRESTAIVFVPIVGLVSVKLDQSQLSPSFLPAAYQLTVFKPKRGDVF